MRNSHLDSNLLQSKQLGLFLTFSASPWESEPGLMVYVCMPGTESFLVFLLRCDRGPLKSFNVSNIRGLSMVMEGEHV